MSRRKSRSRSVRGKPNLIWVASAGDLAQVSGNSVYDALLQPGDWSGTVTESSATLLRMVVTLYTNTMTSGGDAHAENAMITMGDASEGSNMDTMDISNFNEWADFLERHDRVLRIFRLEWSGNMQSMYAGLAVQYSQLPEPVMNLKTPRVLRPDDSIRLWVGGAYTPVSNEAAYVRWFCRSLVRIGLR